MNDYGSSTLDLVIRDPEIPNSLVLGSSPDPEDEGFLSLAGVMQVASLELDVSLQLPLYEDGVELQVSGEGSAQLVQRGDPIAPPIEEYRQGSLLGERYELHSGRVTVEGQDGPRTYDAFALSDPLPALVIVAGIFAAGCLAYQGGRLALIYHAHKKRGRRGKLVIKGGPKFSLTNVDCSVVTYIEEQ
jgi:hypothetical protein